MFRKTGFPSLILSFLLMLGVSLVFSDNPAYWNLEEGTTNVSEYANDSGSFSLTDGCEFTAIRADASISNGDYSANMNAVAHIEISTSDDAHASVSCNGSGTNSSGTISLVGEGISGCTWYWSVDTRNNNGVGSAWCRWRWDCE
jgi:hypothetical protein